MIRGAIILTSTDLTSSSCCGYVNCVTGVCNTVLNACNLMLNSVVKANLVVISPLFWKLWFPNRSW